MDLTAHRALWHSSLACMMMKSSTKHILKLQMACVCAFIYENVKQVSI